MSIEKITSKILGDAETERDIMLADARAQSDAVLAEAEKIHPLSGYYAA